MFVFFQRGGPVMYVLLICSIFALGIFVERFIYLKKQKKKITFLYNEINSFKFSDLDSIKMKLTEIKDNILSKLLIIIIDEKSLPVITIKEAVQREANKEIPHLEKYLSALAVIYNISPMLGLLGTVLGLSITLQDLVSKAALTPDNLLGGIYTSLITTIAGLVIAIPAHIAYSYLVSKVNNIVLDLEIKSSTFLEKIKN